ncbi:Hypp2730 [Branchiostoma lanceolatum]|uniref:Hypp2730 protein n=1 Tax=Branchiostoma lanceolatum TaxID=7740 RepID=A0A8J9ZYN3_BRALA|nr:Hypp2730 [Branchiostoma lanceolatum]
MELQTITAAPYVEACVGRNATLRFNLTIPANLSHDRLYARTVWSPDRKSHCVIYNGNTKCFGDDFTRRAKMVETWYPTSDGEPTRHGTSRLYLTDVRMGDVGFYEGELRTAHNINNVKTLLFVKEASSVCSGKPEGEHTTRKAVELAQKETVTTWTKGFGSGFGTCLGFIILTATVVIWQCRIRRRDEEQYMEMADTGDASGAADPSTGYNMNFNRDSASTVEQNTPDRMAAVRPLVLNESQDMNVQHTANDICKEQYIHDNLQVQVHQPSSEETVLKSSFSPVTSPGGPVQHPIGVPVLCAGSSESGIPPQIQGQATSPVNISDCGAVGIGQTYITCNVTQVFGSPPTPACSPSPTSSTSCGFLSPEETADKCRRHLERLYHSQYNKTCPLPWYQVNQLSTKDSYIPVHFEERSLQQGNTAKRIKEEDLPFGEEPFIRIDGLLQQFLASQYVVNNPPMYHICWTKWCDTKKYEMVCIFVAGLAGAENCSKFFEVFEECHQVMLEEGKKGVTKLAEAIRSARFLQTLEVSLTGMDCMGTDRAAVVQILKAIQESEWVRELILEAHIDAMSEQVVMAVPEVLKNKDDGNIPVLAGRLSA